MIRFRCSGLGRNIACAASVVPPEIRIDQTTEQSALGDSFHAGMSSHVDGREERFSDALGRLAVDQDELDRLLSFGRSQWAKLSKFFPNAVTEHEFEDLVVERDGAIVAQLTGHADVVSLSDDGATVYILDWKSGWGDAGHEMQVRGYALLALREVPSADKVNASVLRVRFSDLQTYEWTRTELEEWFAALVEKVLREKGIYRPSLAACGYCPRSFECPARRTMLSECRALVAEVAEQSPATLAPERLADAVEAARAITKLCDRVVDFARAEVRKAGNKIELADGRLMQLRDVVRTEIDFCAGEGVLREHLGDSLGPCLKVGKTAVEDAVKARAKRGDKKAAAERLMYELDQAAALKLTASPRLEILPAAKAITEG